MELKRDKQKAQEGGCGAPVHLCHWDVEGWMASAWEHHCITAAVLDCEWGEEGWRVGGVEWA